MNAALEAGYRHIDTAFAYENEAFIGKVLKKWLDSGKIKREDLFITTKLPMFGVHPDRVDYFFKKSLENLQLDYVDLYLVHLPICFKFDSTKTVAEQRANRTPEDKTDHIGVWKVTGFTKKKLIKFLSFAENGSASRCRKNQNYRSVKF